MKGLAPWAALLVLGSGLASGKSSGQALGEVAEREKARRAQSKGDPIPVIGDEELLESRGAGLSIVGLETSAEPDEAPSDESTDSAEDDVLENRSLSEKEVREYRETWARVWAERLEAAERELELAEEAVFQCQSAAHYVYVPLAVDCNGVYERRAIADYRLEEIRQNRYNWELLLPERKRPPPQQ